MSQVANILRQNGQNVLCFFFVCKSVKKYLKWLVHVFISNFHVMIINHCYFTHLHLNNTFILVHSQALNACILFKPQICLASEKQNKNPSPPRAKSFAFRSRILSGKYGITVCHIGETI